MKIKTWKDLPSGTEDEDGNMGLICDGCRKKKLNTDCDHVDLGEIVAFLCKQCQKMIDGVASRNG